MRRLLVVLRECSLDRMPVSTGARKRYGRKMREREAFVNQNCVDLLCPCGKRLGMLYLTSTTQGRNRGAESVGEGIDGVLGGQDLSDWSGAEGGGGRRSIAHEDWHRIVCRRCKRDHRTREADLVVLVRSARVRKADRVMLRPVSDDEKAKSGGIHKSGYDW